MSTRRRRLLIGLALLVGGVAALAWFAPAVVANTPLRDRVLKSATADLAGGVQVEGMSLGWLSPVELRGVAVTDAAGAVVATADRVTTSLTLWQLARGPADLGTITVDRPVVTVVMTDGASNVEQLIANYLKPAEPAGDRPGVVVVVTDGRVVLRDAAGEGAFDPVAATVTVPRSRTEPVTLTASARHPSGPLEVDAAFGDDTRVSLDATGFDAAAISPAVRRFAPGTAVGGAVTAKLTATHGSRTSVDGRATVTGLSLASPWLGTDTLKLASADLPVKLELAGNTLRVDAAALTCDAGTASLAGTIDLSEPPQKWLDRPGLSAKADIDVAKLTAIVPALLHVRPGTALTDGRLTLDVSSTGTPSGTTWAGKVNATAVRGTRDGRPLVWEKPLSVAFAGRLLSSGLPAFDHLEAQTDFVGLAARGSADEFQAAANLNLDRLAVNLGQFVDLTGFAVGGRGRIDVQAKAKPDGTFDGTATAKLTDLTLTAGGQTLREPDLSVEARATGTVANGTARLDGGSARLVAGGDTLTARLIEPVADVRTADAGRASVSVAGDLGRWRSRVGPWAGVPADWQFAGTGTVTGDIALSADAVRVPRAVVSLTNAAFRGAGLDVHEKFLKGDATVGYDRRAGVLALTAATITGESGAVTADRFELYPQVKGNGRVSLNVARVQRALGLAAVPSETLAGVAEGAVSVAVGDATTFDFTGNLLGVAYGPPAKPVWTEPKLAVVAAGSYANDAVTLTKATVGRDGLAVDAAGRVAGLSGPKTIDVSGTLAYDLATLDPTLKAYLGKTAQAVGKDRKPFRLAGGLSGTPPLAGTAAVAWQSLKAYGFDVGPAEMTATLDRDVVTLSPVRAVFGGGTVRVEPTVRLTPGELAFAKGRIVEKAKLSPAVFADALGYALPALANSAKADGTVSFDLAEHRIPLADPLKAEVAGTLTLHTAKVAPGPVIAAILTAVGKSGDGVTVANEQPVPVRVKDGRVYHDNFAATVNGYVIRTSGSVGLDGSLAIVADLPVPAKTVERALAKAPRLRDALAKQTVKVPIGGTVSQPRLDARAFDAAADQMVQALLKTVGEDLLNKGADKLRDELLKKLGGGKK